MIKVLVIVLLLIGITSISYALLAVWVTMHSSIENGLEGLEWWLTALWYLVGPLLTGLNLIFWFGAFVTVIGLLLLRRSD